MSSGFPRRKSSPDEKKSKKRDAHTPERYKPAGRAAFRTIKEPNSSSEPSSAQPHTSNGPPSTRAPSTGHPFRGPPSLGPPSTAASRPRVTYDYGTESFRTQSQTSNGPPSVGPRSTGPPSIRPSSRETSRSSFASLFESESTRTQSNRSIASLASAPQLPESLSIRPPSAGAFVSSDYFAARSTLPNKSNSAIGSVGVRSNAPNASNASSRSSSTLPSRESTPPERPKPAEDFYRHPECDSSGQCVCGNPGTIERRERNHNISDLGLSCQSGAWTRPSPNTYSRNERYR